MKTWAQLKTEIRNQIWPSGEQENLVSVHDLLFQEAAAEISKWVECEQQRNVDLVYFCKTYFKCGMTIIKAPKGIVTRVFTVANENYCDPVFYYQREWPVPECWARNLLKFTSPLNVGFPKLPLGFQSAEKSTDAVCGRARTGIWAIYDGNIYISPWIQSNEFVVVEWRGIKTQWGDDDLVNDSQDYKKALKLYLQYAHERDYGSSDRAMEFSNRAKSGSFDEALADLMWQCREETKVRASKECSDERDRLVAEILDDAVPDEAGPLVVGQVANMSDFDSNAVAVADLVNGFSASNVITAGNNASGEYAPSIGSLYATFVDANTFWPVPGEDDWRDASLEDYTDYFNLPNNERYYDVCLGNVHFFFLDSDENEPDGVTFNSTQAQWLRAKLALSVAPWKVVVLHESPYSSTSPNPILIWTYGLWGADLVISGGARNYERFDIDGVPFINNGLGGDGAIENFGYLGDDLVPDGAAYSNVINVFGLYEYSLTVVDGQQYFVTFGANESGLRNGPDTVTAVDQFVTAIGTIFIFRSYTQSALVTATVRPVIPVAPNSVFRYNSGYGAGRITATETSLLYEFVGLDKSVIDSVELTK